MIGAGVDFGEKAACIALFRAIRALPDRGGASLLVAGNYLAYTSATELLAEFPDLLVARGEGERFILDAIEFRQGLKPRSAVSGAIFRDVETGRIVETELARQSPLEWALPSRDTVPQGNRAGPDGYARAEPRLSAHLHILPPQSQNFNMSRSTVCA